MCRVGHFLTLLLYVFLNVLSKYQSQCNRYYFYAQRPDGEVRHAAALLYARSEPSSYDTGSPPTQNTKNESNILKQTLSPSLKLYWKAYNPKPLISKTYDISPYPTVVMVTTAHQKPSGMDLKLDWGEPASAKYTVLEKRTTPNKQ